MSFNIQQPFVSVIVPVYNGELSIEKTIQALLNQDYPKDRYEIIVVDNGSIDKTFGIIKKYPVTVLEEREIKTSYAARNRGINHARGEILAFTDADAIPRSDWISAAVDLFTAQGPDMIGGAIEFSFSKNPSAAEYLDSLIHLDNEAASYKGTAKTANLFVRKSVFDAIGLFRTDVASGEDVGWTARATQTGFVLIYGPNVFVDHLARGFFELVEKHVRVGSGSITTWKSQGKSSVWIIVRWMSLWTPLLPMRVMITLLRRHKHIMDYPIISMSLIAWICTIGTAIGILKNFFSKNPATPNHLVSPMIVDIDTRYYRSDTWSDFFAFLVLLIRNRRWRLAVYLVRAKFLAWRRASIIVLNHKGVIIGGSVFSDLPLNYNYFDNDSLEKMKELVRRGYCYGSAFVIDKKFRNQGFGTAVLRQRMMTTATRYFFTPSPKSQDLYIRMGAQKYFQGRHTLYLMEGKNTPPPLVTIVMPVFNRAGFIIRAIDSIRNQTYRNWELIIINDGSTDATGDIINQYAQKEPRISIIKLEKNTGVSHARNVGLEKSRGKFIAFLDSDDVYHADKIRQQAHALESLDEKIGLIYTGVTIRDLYGNTRTRHAHISGDVSQLLHRMNPIGTPSRAMIRRTCIESCGMFDESLPAFEDRDLWFRIAQKYLATALPEALVTYYETSDALSAQQIKMQIGYEAFLKKHGLQKKDTCLNIKQRLILMHYYYYRSSYMYHFFAFYAAKYFKK